MYNNIDEMKVMERQNNNNNVGYMWTEEVEEICEKLRINAVNLSDYHRQRYYYYKGFGKYFRIPLIILASLTSTASIGLQPLLNQEIISGITCILGMIMGIISAIEMHLGIQDNMELELKQSKDFYTLAVDIFKVLNLTRDNRGENGRDYLNERYSQYIKMVESSNLLKRKLRVDLLTEIPKGYVDSSRPPTPLSPKSDKSLKKLETELVNMREIKPPMETITEIIEKPKLVRSVPEPLDKLESQIDENESNSSLETPPEQAIIQTQENIII